MLLNPTSHFTDERISQPSSRCKQSKIHCGYHKTDYSAGIFSPLLCRSFSHCPFCMRWKPFLEFSWENTQYKFIPCNFSNKSLLPRNLFLALCCCFFLNIVRPQLRLRFFPLAVGPANSLDNDFEKFQWYTPLWLSGFGWSDYRHLHAASKKN